MANFERTSKPLKTNSFFLFGARGVGKTSLLRSYLASHSVREINLLDQFVEDQYSRNPDQLMREVEVSPSAHEWIVIDEIQKVPKLLDVVHNILENPRFKSPKFALTGSSARKLRKGSANLLAGRAFVYNLFPLTHVEMSDHFNLGFTLNWGSLPRIFSLPDDESRQEYLRS